VLSPRLEVQLKASSQDILQKEHVVFPLPLKKYEELRHKTMLPRLLVVFVLPHEPVDWLQQSEDQMITRRCAYWLSLSGASATKNKKNVTVRLPRTNCLNVENLRGMMEAVSRRKPL
jgi:hypothetical protein